MQYIDGCGLCLCGRTEIVSLLGMLCLHDPVLPIQSMLCLYSTSANITLAYNLGAIGGVMYGLQVGSGILVGMTYVASDDYSFSTLDSAQRDSTYG